MWNQRLRLVLKKEFKKFKKEFKKVLENSFFKNDMKIFNRVNKFNLWKIKMKAWLVY